MACFRLSTFHPEPLLSVPFFLRCIADLTRLPAALPYLAMGHVNANAVLKSSPATAFGFISGAAGSTYLPAARRGSVPPRTPRELDGSLSRHPSRRTSQSAAGRRDRCGPSSVPARRCSDRCASSPARCRSRAFRPIAGGTCAGNQQQPAGSRNKRTTASGVVHGSSHRWLLTPNRASVEVAPQDKDGGYARNRQVASLSADIGTGVAYVMLGVADRERSLNFYGQALGRKVQFKAEDSLALLES